MRYDFVQVKVYGKTTSRTHLAHVLRERTQLIKEPRLKVVGDPEVLYRYRGKRKDAIDYMEVVVYSTPENGEEFTKILDFLRTKLARPEIVAVSHYDESHPHTHILIPWRWDENGKARALRLQRLDFINLGQQIARIRGNVIRIGQGRKCLSIAEFIQDRELARKKIEQITNERDTTLAWLETIIKLYGEIEIVAISDKGKFSIGVYNSVESIPLRKLHAIAGKGNGIYFQPTQNSKRVVFLDDVPERYAMHFPYVVKTSPGKYQVHTPLLVNADVTEVQKLIAKHLGADRGATAQTQPRRLPGFPNQKYEDRPVVTLLQEKPELTKHVNDYIERVLKAQKALERECELLRKQYRQKLTATAKLEKNKTWQDFYDGDESVADMKYAIYLMSLGWTDDEVKAALLDESLDIRTRKRKLEYYLDLTVRKAREYYEQKTLERLSQMQNFGPERR